MSKISNIKVKNDGKKNKTSKFFISIVAMLLVVVMSFGMVSCSGGNSIVTKNADGELVFATTFEEYIERYNAKNGEILDMELSVDDFEFVEYEGSKFYTLGRTTFYVDNENKVERISIMPASENGDIIYAIEYNLAAFYSELNEGDIDDLLEEAFNSVEKTYDTSSVVYKDVKIEYTCAGENHTLQRWDLVPNAE